MAFVYRIATRDQIRWAESLWDGMLYHDRAAVYFMTTGDFSKGMQRGRLKWDFLGAAEQREIAATYLRWHWHFQQKGAPP
jgi:hypothetical protein